MSTEAPAVSSDPKSSQGVDSLRPVVESLLRDLQDGVGDRDKRRLVEEWMRGLSEKYPEFGIERGLRDYYLAEAGRLRKDFDSAKDLVEKLNTGRMVESFLDRAQEYERRISSRETGR